MSPESHRLRSTRVLRSRMPCIHECCYSGWNLLSLRQSSTIIYVFGKSHNNLSQWKPFFFLPSIFGVSKPCKTKQQVKRLIHLFNIPQQHSSLFLDSTPRTQKCYSTSSHESHKSRRSGRKAKRKKRELIMMRNVIVNVWDACMLECGGGPMSKGFATWTAFCVWVSDWKRCFFLPSRIAFSAASASVSRCECFGVFVCDKWNKLRVLHDHYYFSPFTESLIRQALSPRTHWQWCGRDDSKVKHEMSSTVMRACSWGESFVETLFRFTYVTLGLSLVWVRNVAFLGDVSDTYKSRACRSFTDFPSS